MSNIFDFTQYKYAPILSISPAEMTALGELPEKDKDIILPIVPLRGWVGSQILKNSVARIEKAIDQRFWIADIDRNFVDGTKKDELGNYPREVFSEIEKLLISNDGYDNWYQYLQAFPKSIPTVQLEDLDELERQVTKLSALNRGLFVKFSILDIDSGRYRVILEKIKSLNIGSNIFIMFDYGQVSREVLTFSSEIISILELTHEILEARVLTISCSSFPSSFSGYHYGENSIYERLLFNTVMSGISNKISMIYSDRGGARAVKIKGGGGIPSPRIDYALVIPPFLEGVLSRAGLSRIFHVLLKFLGRSYPTYGHVRSFMIISP